MDTDTSEWVRLSLHTRSDQLFVGYEDSRGRRVLPPGTQPSPLVEPAWEPIPPAPVAGGSFDAAVRWPARATGLLFDMAGRLPTVRHLVAGGTQPVALPIFLRPPVDERWDPDFERRVRRVLDVVGIGPERSALMVEARDRPRSPFALPYDISAGGLLPEIDQAVRSLLPGLNDADRDFAIRVRPGIGSPSTTGVDDEPDIVVLSAAEATAGWPVRWRNARLIVTEDTSPPGSAPQPAELPAGTSVVTLRPGPPGRLAEFVHELLREMSHDLALHEATLAAGRALGFDPEDRAGVALYSSPDMLDALRISGAFRRFQPRAQELARYRSVGAVPDPAVPTDVVPRSPALDRAADLARTARAEFLRESDGLSELARAEAAYVSTAPDRDAADRAVASLLDGPAADSTVEHQDRRVTMWLAHDLATHGFRFSELDRNVALARGGDYVLNVAVGLDWPGNLVHPGAPPVDPILPPSSTGENVLDVSVFSDTAVVRGPAVRSLLLPRLGPSRIVTFDLGLPNRGDLTRIRVLIQHREHMVQAYTLHVALAPGEIGRTGAIRVDLDFSRAEQIRSVEDLPERLLGVATNHDTGGGTHRIMFGSSGHAVTLSERSVGTARAYLRDRMAAAFTALDREGHVPTDQFERQVRELAESGSTLWGAIFDKAPDEHQRNLDAVADAASGTVQVLRLEPDFAFPWALLYDRPLPPTRQAIDDAPVCRGGTSDGPCDCDASTANICVRGFWGVRLVVEELVCAVDADRYVHTVSGADGAPAVLCTVGVTPDPWTQDMVSGLAGLLGPSRFSDLTENDSLLDRLWQESTRPAVLVVVGHLTTEPVPTEPSGARVSIRSVEHFLHTDGLRQAKRRHGTRRWDSPYRPIVLLLGCDTGRSGLGEVHDFVSGLTSAGAATILATEEKIDTRLAGSLATSLVPALGRAGVGEGLRAWRARLMGQDNPLGLVFTCFGSADALAPQLSPPST